MDLPSLIHGIAGRRKPFEGWRTQGAHGEHCRNLLHIEQTVRVCRYELERFSHYTALGVFRVTVFMQSASSPTANSPGTLRGILLRIPGIAECGQSDGPVEARTRLAGLV